MEITILLLLIVLNGAFAMSEMAVVSSRKARLQQLADEGRAGAGTALALANKPGNFLSTIQVGITLIGITSGAFGEAALAKGLSDWLSQWSSLDRHSETLAIALVVAGITVTSLILGELVPKRLALLNPERVASLVAKPMRFLSIVAHPVVRALSAATDAIVSMLRLGGIAQPPVSEEEIKVLMAQGAEAGVFEQHEQQLVARAFRFGHMRVGGIMTPRTDFVSLDLDQSQAANVRRIIDERHSRFPVVRGGLDRIEGIVLARDLLADALSGKPVDFARHIKPPLYVPTRISPMELVEQFRRHQQTIAIAINEHGVAEGLVTLNDVMKALVGDIATIEQEGEADIVARDDGSWLIDGSATIERIKVTLEIDEQLPGEAEGGYHTAGGFIMEQLGRIPSAGDSFACAGWRWEVVDMDERRVDKVLAVPLPPTTASDTQ